MRVLPRVLFELPLTAPDGEAAGFSAAVEPDGMVTLHLATEELALPPALALDLARALLAELAPDLAAALVAHERRRALRIVTAGDPGPGGNAA